MQSADFVSMIIADCKQHQSGVWFAGYFCCGRMSDGVLAAKREAREDWSAPSAGSVSQKYTNWLALPKMRTDQPQTRERRNGDASGKMMPTRYLPRAVEIRTGRAKFTWFPSLYRMEIAESAVRPKGARAAHSSGNVQQRVQLRRCQHLHTGGLY